MIAGITSDGGDNIRVCMEALESKYSNESIFHHPTPSSPLSALHIYWQGFVMQESNISIWMVVRLKPN